MKGDRSDRRRIRLAADNRCTRCAEKLAFDDLGVNAWCAECRQADESRLAKQWQERTAAGKCGRCREDLPEGYAKKTCEECLRYIRGEDRAAYFRARNRPLELHRQEKYAQTLERVRQTEDLPGEKAAKTVGVSVDRLYHLRSEVKELGRSAVIEGAMTTPCPRCWLRGPHECIAPIHAIASSRLGPGRVYPGSG